MALIFRRYLTTRPGENLAGAAAQLSAELAAKNVALLMARGGEPEVAQPATHYERETSFGGDHSDLIVSLPNHQTLAAFTAELGEAAWNADLRWLPDEDLPDMVRINRTEDGLPAGLDAAHRIVRGVSLFPLILQEMESQERGQPEGRYATWLPAVFADERVAYTDSGDWAVEVLHRGALSPPAPPQDGIRTVCERAASHDKAPEENRRLPKTMARDLELYSDLLEILDDYATES